MWPTKGKEVTLLDRLALERQRHSAKKNWSSGSHHVDILGVDVAGTAGAGLAAIGKDESDDSVSVCSCISEAFTTWRKLEKKHKKRLKKKKR